MKARKLISTAGALSIIALAVSTAALAQGNSPVHFKGLINDYTASTVKGGPWEMNGTWTLDLRGASGSSDFSADMTMSNYGTKRRRRSDQARKHSSCASCRSEERKRPVEHGGLPRLSGSYQQQHRLSDYGPGQFAHGQWATRALRPRASAIAADGLHHGS